MQFTTTYKRRVQVIGFLFFILGAVAHTLELWAMYRGLRGAVILAYLILLISFHGKQTLRPLIAFMALNSIASFLTIGYENEMLGQISLATNALSFLVLIITILPKIKLRRIKPVLLIVFLALISINGYLCYSLVDMLKPMITSTLMLSIVYMHTLLLIVLTLAGLLYNFVFSTKASWVLTMIVLLIFFAEILRAIGYYGIAFENVAVYLARILTIIMGAMIIRYSFIAKTEEESLTNKVF